jgi:hypothetical protein
MMRRCVQIQVEDVPGQAMPVDPDLWTTLVYDAQIKPTAEMEEIEKPGSDAYMASEIGALLGELTFKHRPTAGAAQPDWSPILAACGLGFSTPAFVLDQTFPETVASTVKTLTMYVWEDGALKCIYGAAGNPRMSGTAGKTVLFDETFKGKWLPPVAMEKPTITYPTFSPLRFVGSGLMLDFGSGDVFNPKVSTFSLDLGNELYPELDGGGMNWAPLEIATDYTAVPASTATLTMITDQSDSIKPGMAVQFTIGGVTKMAKVVTCATSLLTVAGTPFGGTLTALAWSAKDLTGVNYVLIPKRRVKLTLDPLSTLLSGTNAHDLYAHWLEQEMCNVQFSLNNAAGDTAVFAMTGCQYDLPAPGDRNRLMKEDVVLLNQNNDLSITFTPHSS